MDEDARTETAGEKAVGHAFNPSQDPKVAELKKLFAEAFDIVEQHVGADNGENQRHRKLRDAALHEILSAQMWAVKVVTWSK